MSDLIDKQVVLDTIHRFFTEEVEKIPTKKTEDGEVYVIHKCQPLFEMNKAICKRIKALPSVSPTQNCVESTLDMRCDDAISRQGVLEQTYNWSKDEFLRVTNPFDYLRKRINSLPPVNPQEPKCCDRNICISNEYNGISCDECEVTKSQKSKTGHWIRWYEQKEHDTCIENIPHCKCSECGKEYDSHSSQFIKYCNECGAKMSESEDKE